MPAIVNLWRDLLAYHQEIGETDIQLGPAAVAYGREFIEENVGRKHRLCLLAEQDEISVGFLVATLRKRSPAFGGWQYGHIYDVYVPESHRNLGVGTALVSEAFRWFRKHGVRRVQLQVRARNALGIDFWKALGFEALALTMEKTI